MPVTRHRRVEGVVTQRPPPQIVACGFPALRSAAHDSPLSIRLQVHIGDGQLRPYQEQTVFALLKLFPVYFAVLTALTSGLPPELLGLSGETLETLDVSRSPVVVVVAAQILIACLLLRLYRRMEHVSDAPIDGLCRSAALVLPHQSHVQDIIQVSISEDSTDPASLECTDSDAFYRSLAPYN